MKLMEYEAVNVPLYELFELFDSLEPVRPDFSCQFQAHVISAKNAL